MMMAAVIGVVAMDDEQAADAAPNLFDVDGIMYGDQGDYTVSVWNVPDSVGSSVVIPEFVTYQGHDYTVVNFHDTNSETMVSITLPETIESLGTAAFSKATSLETVIFNSENAPNTKPSYVFAPGSTVNIYTPGWNPVEVFPYDVSKGTTIVWANPPPEYPDLTFLSNPVTNGTLAYNPLRTIKTALTA